MILPIISLLPFLQRNLSEKFAVLKKGPHYAHESGYNTLKQAQDDGALVLAYGYVIVLEAALSLAISLKRKGRKLEGEH
jgi:large conductance mechanosensitive channel